jgi:hypothetical protein
MARRGCGYTASFVDVRPALSSTEGNLVLGVQQPPRILLLLRVRPDRSIQQCLDRLVTVDQTPQLPLKRVARDLIVFTRS